jgi:hypothetical protein
VVKSSDTPAQNKYTVTCHLLCCRYLPFFLNADNYLNPQRLSAKKSNRRCFANTHGSEGSITRTGIPPNFSTAALAKNLVTPLMANRLIHPRCKPITRQSASRISDKENYHG